MLTIRSGFPMFVLNCFMAFCANAQTDSSFLKQAADKLSRQPAAEKVYLHLDKQNYLYGDTIWYKAYTVIGQHHQLSALSEVLCVELFNLGDSLISRQSLHLISGLAWGDIPIPKTLKQGNYRIRAYTNWMRNFGTDYFYDKKITVGSIAASISKQSPQGNPDVQFFPEGGQLVNGIRSRVAVKAVGTDGLGENIEGTIEDNEGNLIAAFSTQHLGMGVFAIIPQSGKTYKAKINVSGATAFTVDLPKPQDEGFTLTLNNSQKDSLYLKVSTNNKVFNEQKNSFFYILGQDNGIIYYSSKGKLESPVFSAQIDKRRFPTGIVKFTLFSQGGEPLAERIVFVQSSDTLQLNLTSNATSYTIRQGAKIVLQAQSNAKPVEGSFSAAVINENHTAMDENSENTILNNLLLTSDLKGYVEQPNYYFTNANDQTRSDLDILMLTQGYRGFEWKQVLSNSNSAINYQPEKSLEMEGYLKTSSGKPAANGKITLLATKEKFIADTTADAQGNFKFTGLNFSDTAKVVLRARKEHNGSNVIIYVKNQATIKIDKAKMPYSDTRALSPAILAAAHKNDTDYTERIKFDSLKKSRLLKEVKITASKPSWRHDLPYSSNLNGGGNADQVIMGDKLDGCVILSDCLQGRVFGVRFGNDGTPFSMRSQGRLGGQPAMELIVDGNMLPGSYLNNLNASDIGSIEVLKTGALLAVYGSSAPGGALVITTKRGADGYSIANADPKGIITYPFIGFYKARTFYSPKYTHQLTANEQPDMRNTIYWNPNIITDKDGHASFEYFNNDAKGSYRVVVEGIDDNGNLGRQVFRYRVE